VVEQRRIPYDAAEEAAAAQAAGLPPWVPGPVTPPDPGDNSVWLAVQQDDTP
jgi:hypothetical protein